MCSILITDSYMYICIHANTHNQPISYIAILCVQNIAIAICIAILPIATYAYTCRIPSAIVK